MKDEYTSFDIPGRGTRYMKNGKLVKAGEVPLDEVERLTKGNVIEQPTAPLADRNCLFCGAHSRFSKFVNLRTVPLCDDHYYAMTTGKIAQKMREVS